ncbi:hypothetical protein VTO73DRAFT_9184 [Trametes versicolor]
MQHGAPADVFLPQMYEESDHEELFTHEALLNDMSNIVFRDSDEETTQGEEVELQSGPLDDAWKLCTSITPRVVTSSNSLSPEILALIFGSTVGAVPALNSHLIRVTHVCRYWRDVALHTPALWTHIALLHPDAINAFLERSQALPLSIHLHMNPRPNPASPEGIHTDALRALLTGFSRTLSLKINHLSSEGYDLVMKRIARGAPKLEVLSIAKRTIGTGSMLDHAPDDVDGLPRLRSLKLRGEPLPWLPTWPNALTEIDLVSAVHDAPALLDLLERSPALEHVTIRGFFNAVVADDPHEVTLAHLKTLRLHSFSIPGIATLLPSLDLPSQHTNISLGDPKSRGGAFADLIPMHDESDPLPWAALRGLKRVQLKWDQHEYQTLCAYRSAALDDPAPPALQVQAFGGEWAMGERFFFNWPIDAAHVETVDVYGDRSAVASLDRWRTMLLSVPALKTLRVRAVDGDLQDVLRALAPEADPLLCPRLETLILARVSAAQDAADSLVDAVSLGRSPAMGGCLTTVTVEMPTIEPAVADAWLGSVCEDG